MKVEQQPAASEMLAESHEETRRAVSRLHPEMVVHPNSGWTVRDVLGHIGVWDVEAARSITAFTTGSEYSLGDHDEDEYNTKAYHRMRQLDADGAQAAWEQARSEFIEAVRLATAETPTGDLLYPWGDRGTVAQLVVEMIEHDVEHRTEIVDAAATSR